MTDKERNLTSWVSALSGLRILIDQNDKLYTSQSEPATYLNASMMAAEKEKVKKAIDFLSYVLGIEVTIKKKGLFR